MTERLVDRYRRLLTQGAIVPDSAQELGVEKLQMLSNRLATYSPPLKTDFLSFFTRRRGEVPKGLYMFGGVGRGKTMLMDLFFETAPVDKKRRAHFHEFMADIHARLDAARKKGKNGDAVLAVAADVALETSLLCLDELFIIDIADATIVSRLFTALFEKGVIVVTTSNAKPDDLYKDGRNRDLFLPFIEVIEHNMEVLQLESARDFRLSHLGDATLYFSPVDAAAKAAVDNVWRKVTFGEPCAEETLTVLGHAVHIPCSSMGAARFGWADLFQKPLGAQDYSMLARRYHAIFLDGIPLLSQDRRNEARRFITFIDTLYDHGTGLVASADAEPGELYKAGEGADHFERTASRLIEMRSVDYLSKNTKSAAALVASPTSQDYYST